ncbi:MAG TPA: hypothetical protein VNX66_02595 [Candidatus Sulfotelmatobacter sp.]|jgi:hypothetical protein|nr:hypothetical protein [Candidatus Sulfotelmatobacter sp.]
MHRSCRVTVTGLDDVTYSVVVTAESVYEAIALGMTEIRDSPWAGKIAEGLNTVTVQILEVTTEHTIRFIDFEKWVNQEPAAYPGEMIRRKRVREILGLEKADKRH